MTEIGSFDGISEEFLDYSERTRGVIRYTLEQENLAPFVESKNVKTALDVCSGSGIDAAWLAGKGLMVTTVEPSLDQIQLARNRFATLDPSVRKRIAEPFQMDFLNYNTER